MSLRDKILNLYEKYSALSSERVTFLLEREYKLKRNIRTIQREISKLVRAKKLTALPLKGREQTYELCRKQPSTFSSVFLSRIWDEIFAIRKGLHCPEKQFEKNWENFLRLRSLVQLLPEDFKHKIKPKIDDFRTLDEEAKNRIGKAIGFHPILTLGGVPFGDEAIARKKRKNEIIDIIMEEKIEEIIGEVSSCLHEALKEERLNHE